MLNLINRSRRIIFCSFLTTIAVVIYAVPLLAAPTDADPGRAISESLDLIWKELLLGEDGKITIFKILCNTLSGFAILAIGWETAYLAARSKSFDNPRAFVQEFVLEKMLPTVLVAAALSNNGYIAGHALYQSKNMFLGIDKVAYESFMFKAGTGGLANAQADAASVLTPIGDGFENCYSIPDRIGGKTNPQLIQCLQGLTATIDTALTSGKLQDAATIAKLTKSRDLLNTAIASDNPASEMIKSGAALRGAVNKESMSGWIEGTFEAILTALGLMYYVVIELAFLIMALSASIILMLSFLKMEVLLKFLPQFINIFIAKLTYTIAMGLSIVLQNTAGGDLGKWAVSLMVGVGCPFISIYMMLALSGSISSVFERSAMDLAGAGARGAGRAVGSAAGGARWAGGKLAGAMRGGGGGGAAGAGGMRQISGGARAGSGGGQTIDVVARRV
jgi:hypothetical protein